MLRLQECVNAKEKVVLDCLLSFGSSSSKVALNELLMVTLCRGL